MQSPYFNKNTNSPAISYHSLNTPIIPPVEEDDYSNNVLNQAFIAEESHLALSDSANE